MPIRPENKHLYPSNWKEISNYIRFTRAMGKCEWCDAVHKEPHPETGSMVILTVAHIDQNPRNNDQENLAALCQRCHLNHDRDQHNRNAAETRHKKRVKRDEERGQRRFA